MEKFNYSNKQNRLETIKLFVNDFILLNFVFIARFVHVKLILTLFVLLRNSIVLDGLIYGVTMNYMYFPWYCIYVKRNFMGHNSKWVLNPSYTSNYSNKRILNVWSWIIVANKLLAFKMKFTYFLTSAASVPVEHLVHYKLHKPKIGNIFHYK